MRLRTAAIMLGIFLSVSVATAQPAGVRLEYKLTPGMAATYRTAVKGTGAVSMLDTPQPFALASQITETYSCRGLMEDGVAMVEITTDPASSVTVTIADQPQTTLLRVPPVRILMDKRGRILAAAGLEQANVGLPIPGLDLNQILMQGGQLGLPDREVKVGDTWTDSIPVKTATGATVQMQQNSRLAGFERVNGMDCAKIEQTTVLPVEMALPTQALGLTSAIKGQITITGAKYFAYEKGLLVKDDGVIDLNLQISTSMQAQGQEISIPGTMTGRLQSTRQLQP
jgi:hypothetical protein